MLRISFARAARSRPVPSIYLPARIAAPIQRRTFLRSRDARGSFDSLNVERMSRERQDYERTRTIFLAAGSVAGIIGMVYTGLQIKRVLEQNPKKLDAGPSADPSLSPRKVVVHDKDGYELVPTGNSTVPEFPRTLDLHAFKHDGSVTSRAHPVQTDPDSPSTEYTLVGVGTRTVSFLSIQVYVVGFYVATADIAALQNRLIKNVNPVATTLVAGEKEELRNLLLDPIKGEDIWEKLLADGVPARSLIRITPVRDTDFPHLRDGFVRSIQARAPRIIENSSKEGKDAPDFSESVRQFRHCFNRGKIPKKQELLLVRGENGHLSIVYDDGRSFGRQYLGSVADERLCRALWMNYLGGIKIASQPTLKSIVDGLLGFVERPVGTVATQVV